MPRITVKGLAKYMTSGAAQQRKVLHDYKFPNPEGAAQATYYREARDSIRAFHNNNHPVEWLTDKANRLNSQAQQESGATRTRLRNNATAVNQYATHFGQKTFNLLPTARMNLSYHGVVISVNPELHVQEKKSEKIIKLDFAADAPDPTVIKIVSQSMYEAQMNHGLGLPGSCVLYMDVRRGVSHRGARAGSRLRNDIEAACQNIAAIWPSI